MTARERAIEATWDTGAGDWTTVDRERLEMAVEQAITAAVEEKELTITRDLNRQMAEIQDAAIARITELEVENARTRTALGIFEDGANWERYGGLSEPAEYVWRHDSDPRVLAQDARSTPAE